MVKIKVRIRVRVKGAGWGSKVDFFIFFIVNYREEC